MTIQDGLTVSLVGITVVFSGLLITSWLISAISLVPAWLQRLRPQVPPPPPVAPFAPAPVAAVTPAPAADVAAVISALLEVEMRLHGGERAERFTFRRDPAVADWRGDAGRRPNPPERGLR
ncbi:MAG: OadG family protein [Candidatus Aminicenantes bacterium]|nr:OadG family protein [Candidatus Aminicenantes bacterium]